MSKTKGETPLTQGGLKRFWAVKSGYRSDNTEDECDGRSGSEEGDLDTEDDLDPGYDI